MLGDYLYELIELSNMEGGLPSSGRILVFRELSPLYTSILNNMGYEVRLLGDTEKGFLALPGINKTEESYIAVFDSGSLSQLFDSGGQDFIKRCLKALFPGTLFLGIHSMSKDDIASQEPIRGLNLLDLYDIFRDDFTLVSASQKVPKEPSDGASEILISVWRRL